MYIIEEMLEALETESQSKAARHGLCQINKINK